MVTLHNIRYLTPSWCHSLCAWYHTLGSAGICLSAVLSVLFVLSSALSGTAAGSNASNSVLPDSGSRDLDASAAVPLNAGKG